MFNTGKWKAWKSFTSFIVSRVRTCATEVSIFTATLCLVDLLLKFRILTDGGFQQVQSMLGVSHLSPFEYLRLFAGEFWESLFYFPLVLLLIGLLRGSARSRITSYACVLQIALFVALVQWASYETIGEFPDKTLINDFFSTLKSNPEFVSPQSLMSKRVQAGFVGIFIIGLLPVAVAMLLPVRLMAKRSRLVILSVGASVLIVVGPAPGSVAGLDRYRAGPFQRLSSELLPGIDIRASGRAIADPLQEYREAIFPDGSPRSNSLRLQRPRVRAANVVFIVLETAGFDDYPFTGPKSKMPNVAALVPHSLIALRHYSTDVESIRSNFSLYSSIYELPGRGQNQYFLKHLESAGNGRELDALPRILASQGYVTRYYFPFNLWPKKFEEDSLHRLGFQGIRLANQTQTDPDYWKELTAWNRMALFSPPDFKTAAERATYQMAISDMAKIHAEGKPFFMAIAGSIGHAPFTDLRPADVIKKNPNPSRADLIGAIATFQDELVGQIIAALRDMNILEDTIVVITGDHGPRTRIENPTLDLTLLSEENFHIPLLIHYPASFPKTLFMNSLTSQVDVAPTVLDLLGIDRTALLEQGVSMFDNAIDDKITFFLGEHLLSGNALHYEGKFLMFSRVTQTLYVNNRFAFGNANVVRNPDGIARKLLDTLRTFGQIQNDWILNFRTPIENHSRFSAN